MCYYEQTLYTCRDWKWGNMKERCPRQHRMGETCGVKMVDTRNVYRADDQCRTCKDIEIKDRKLNKELQNIARWRKEGRKFLASIEKAENEVERLQDQIKLLRSNRSSVKADVEMNNRAKDLMHPGEAAACPPT
jgi:septal ring factor EnvC (AmiA/AmiB activator)